MMHPATYLNKVLFASTQGAFQLWNLRTGKMVHAFKGWNSCINVVEQAPAVDVVAFGLKDGRIILHNIKLDETIMTFTQETLTASFGVSGAEVTALSFRTDGKAAIMASGSPDGHIALWDLEERKLQSEIRFAHDGPVVGLEFQQGEPLLLSNSSDNTLKQWIFDMGADGGRQLRVREGHSEPPCRVFFYGENGEEILTAGRDSSVRVFATFKADGTFKNLGKAVYNKKSYKKVKRKDRQGDAGEGSDKANDYMRKIMPPIAQMAGVMTRTKEWADIVACHENCPLVTTWSYYKTRMGDLKLLHDRFKHDPKLKKIAATTRSSNSEESRIFCWSLGISMRGSDCNVKFWRFKTCQYGVSAVMPAPVSFMRVHRDSGLLGIALDDFSVRVVDLDDRNPKTIGRPVRRLEGRHSAVITDMTFSPDARWLLTASADSTVLVWDLVTGLAMDWFKVPHICTSMSFSPSGEFLATSHSGCLGVYLWVNKTIYVPSSGARSLPVDYKPRMLPLPGATIEKTGEGETEEEEEEIEKTEVFVSPEQISNDLVTLALLPESKWANLLNLDVIKARNKPKEPPKVPKSAPFFLPTVAGLTPQFDLSAEKEHEEGGDAERSRLLRMTEARHLSEFAKLVHRKLMEVMKQYGPSKIDVEVRSLAPANGGDVELMMNFLKSIFLSFEECKNFEAAQAYLGIFLKIHWDEIPEHSEVADFLPELLEKQRWSWKKLSCKITDALCLANFLDNVVL
ncbi:unnamed protein product [Notodromas monacha]|uniref:WD repeat-containing protein 36 n=1 Tax=Notodromas monacha TaxID=399045 RepID=A0A7R9GJC0_9CRUS|nr:unnamed protein product [Notodromas monacha]CAG0923391.1 unnamed protein product [Notodromas monacha]